MKTVFFGPFIGEFGWELLFWQGWVRKVCKGEFEDYRKIACSYPGRYPFYPYVDDFWPLPDWFLKLSLSAHGYYTDSWRDGFPGRQYEAYTPRSFVSGLWHLRRPQRRWVEKSLDMPSVEPRAEKMLAEFKARLPDNGVCFVPWKWNNFVPDNLEFGVLSRNGIALTSDAPVTTPIPFHCQLLEYLYPTTDGQQALAELLPDRKNLLAIFPRHRIVRRQDKNWPREKYLRLISGLQVQFPDLRIAILGEIGGSYFTDGVPEGCVDLINIDAARRMDIQLAALKRSVMAIGSMSGALLVALAAGCPALIWGIPDRQVRYHRENFMGTAMIYHADPNPEVQSVLELVLALLRTISGSRACNLRLGLDE